MKKPFYITLERVEQILYIILKLILTLLLLLTIFVPVVKTATKPECDYAMVKFPDGTSEIIEIRNWMDYESEQFQITDVMGNTYVVNSVNCVLVDEYAEE